MPVDVRANDLVHWQTTLVTRGIDALGRSALASKWDLVSPGVVTLADGQLGFQKGLLVRDRDGHGVQLIET
jgi:hypothetical protein